MPKLKKAEFNSKFRFRECREISFRDSRSGLVNCVSCANMAGGANDGELALCEHEERLRRVRIAEHWPGFGGRKSLNIASRMVCDGYEHQPLPDAIKLPVLPEKHVIVLGTQWRDIYHADPNCPYVLAELLMISAPEDDASPPGGEKKTVFNASGIETRDISYLVPQETVGAQICEMSCCSDKLPYHTRRVDDYRRKAGIQPDGSEEKPWVRNGIRKHDKKVNMTPEEAEAVFDLGKFNILDKDLHGKIVAVSEHLHKNCNVLGSRPLSEVSNPVCLGPYYHIFDSQLVGADSNADVWAYDERLFNIKRGLEKPLTELREIPEGILPCMDTRGVFRAAHSYCERHWGSFSIYGILRELSNEVLLSKGLLHYVEIGAVSFHGHEHMWGEFGVGFKGLASFHEE